MCGYKVTIYTNSKCEYLIAWGQKNIQCLYPNSSVQTRISSIENHGTIFYQYRDEVMQDIKSST